MDVEFAHAAQIPKARQAILSVCRLMHQRNYIAASDGNVSVRIGEKKLLVTPSGARKGFMEPSELILCDLKGNPLHGERGRPSSEIRMHTTIYAERPDIRAIVHAHPPCAVAHTIVNQTLATPLLPEVYCELGEIRTVPYTTPTTAEVPEALRDPIRCRGIVALLMERHGSITMGETLGKAYDRLEIVEHAARISLMAHTLDPGRVRGLDEAQLHKLQVFLGCGLGC